MRLALGASDALDNMASSLSGGELPLGASPFFFFESEQKKKKKNNVSNSGHRRHKPVRP